MSLKRWHGKESALYSERLSEFYMTNSLRQWLIAALTHRPLPPLAAQQTAEHFGRLSASLIDAARNEGVLLLLEQSIAEHPDAAAVPIAVREAVQAAAKSELFGQLDMQREQQQVFLALAQTGLPFLVLKGGALAHWLYARPHLRLVTDLDILLPDKAWIPEVAAALAGIGYVQVAGNPVANELSFHKPGGPYGRFIVDAHWRLFNRALLRDTFGFDELYGDAIDLPAMHGIKGLGPVHALFNACGHRALSLPHRQITGIQRADCLRWLWDIHALALRFSADDWRRMTRLAGEKRISAILQEALETTGATFGTAIPDETMAQLRRQMADEPLSMRWFSTWSGYQWREFLASSPNMKGRLHWLKQMLLLESLSVRERYGPDDPSWKLTLKRLSVGLRRLFS